MTILFGNGGTDIMGSIIGGFIIFLIGCWLEDLGKRR